MLYEVMNAQKKILRIYTIPRRISFARRWWICGGGFLPENVGKLLFGLSDDQQLECVWVFFGCSSAFNGSKVRPLQPLLIQEEQYSFPEPIQNLWTKFRFTRQSLDQQLRHLITSR